MMLGSSHGVLNHLSLLRSSKLTDLEQWTVDPVETISVQELDQLVKTYHEKRQVHEEAKRVASEKYQERADAENKLFSALTATGKSSYRVDGVGNVSIRNKYVVACPSELADKEALFLWLAKEHGKDVLYSKASINHNTLNAFYNAEAKVWEEQQNELPAEERKPFSLPGVSAPTLRQDIAFKKEAK